MNRFKLNVIVSVFVLFSFCACVGASFYSSMLYCLNQYQEFENEFFLSVGESISSDLVIYDDDTDIDFQSFVSTQLDKSYPNVVAVYNDKCELIAKKGAYIDAGHYIDNDSSFSFFMPVQEYLTDDIAEQIRDYAEETESLDVIRIDYHKSGDDFIPVNLYLNRNLVENDYLKLKLNDLSIDGAYSSDSCERVCPELLKDTVSGFFYMNFGTIFSQPHDQKLYDELIQGLESEEVLNCVNQALGNGGECTGFGDGTIAHCTESILIGGKNYVVFYECADDIFADTITSDIFLQQLKMEVVVFVIFGIILLAVFNTAYSKNRRLENARRAFISAAAHELKTPLAAIINNSDCIIDKIAPEKNEKYLDNINKEGRRMSALVATLLQYNKLVSATSVEKEQVSLTDIVNNELDIYIPFIDDRQLVLNIDIEESAYINANEGLISLAVDNFLSNAVKYTDKGKAINVSLKKYKSGYKLAVFNECNGIDKSIKNSLWDAFSRADKARSSKDASTGMGLAICKQILELHKFKYGFENKNGGVEFYFITGRK